MPRFLLVFLLSCGTAVSALADITKSDLNCYVLTGSVTACAPGALPSFEFSNLKAIEVKCGTIDPKSGTSSTDPLPSLPTRYTYMGKSEPSRTFCQRMSDKTVVLMYERISRCKDREQPRAEVECNLSNIVVEIEEHLKNCPKSVVTIGTRTLQMGCDGALREATQ